MIVKPKYILGTILAVIVLTIWAATYAGVSWFFTGECFSQSEEK
jgi:hypothetical protein